MLQSSLYRSPQSPPRLLSSLMARAFDVTPELAAEIVTARVAIAATMAEVCMIAEFESLRYDGCTGVE